MRSEGPGVIDKLIPAQLLPANEAESSELICGQWTTHSAHTGSNETSELDEPSRCVTQNATKLGQPICPDIVERPKDARHRSRFE